MGGPLSRRDAVRLAVIAAALGVTIGVDPRRLLAQEPKDATPGQRPAAQQKKTPPGDPPKEFTSGSPKTLQKELQTDTYEGTTVQRKPSTPNQVNQVKVRKPDLTPEGVRSADPPDAVQMKRGATPGASQSK